jgi:ammonia channel protein AmtB
MITIAILIVITFFSGFRLAKTGKPFNNLLLTSHKLISLALLVLAVIQFNYLQKLNEINLYLWILFTAAAALFVLEIISGALLSAYKTERLAGLVHKVVPFVLLLAFGLLFYLSYLPKHA